MDFLLIFKMEGLNSGASCNNNSSHELNDRWQGIPSYSISHSYFKTITWFGEKENIYAGIAHEKSFEIPIFTTLKNGGREKTRVEM